MEINERSNNNKKNKKKKSGKQQRVSNSHPKKISKSNPIAYYIWFSKFVDMLHTDICVENCSLKLSLWSLFLFTLV